MKKSRGGEKKRKVLKEGGGYKQGGEHTRKPGL